MNSEQVFFTQVALSTLVYALCAGWYVAPSLARLPRNRALAPLLVLHTFRTVGLIFLVPAVVGSRLPDTFVVPEAYGDLLAAVLAVGALVALRAGWRAAVVLVWVFNLEGTADLVNAIVQGARVNIAGGSAVGPGWFIPTFIVPALLVTHVVIFWLLLRPQRLQRAAGTSDDPSSNRLAAPIAEYAIPSRSAGDA